jgi:hypothetical protein
LQNKRALDFTGLQQLPAISGAIDARSTAQEGEPAETRYARRKAGLAPRLNHFAALVLVVRAPLGETDLPGPVVAAIELAEIVIRMKGRRALPNHWQAELPP